MTLHVVCVDDEAQRGSDREGACSGDAERQGGHRGERGYDSGNRERFHNRKGIDCFDHNATAREKREWAGRVWAEWPMCSWIELRANDAGCLSSERGFERWLYFNVAVPHDRGR